MSFVYMKVLESTPLRYDRGLRLLSRGRIEWVYARIAELVAAPGRRVLDIGCGTGGVTIACAARGADVVGIDRSPGMLEVARSKSTASLKGRLEWVELGAAEIEDRFPAESFDAAVACLSFSEFSPEEQSYAVEIIRTRLKPGGSFVLADEVLPASALGRTLYRIRRLPFVLAALLVSQTTTHALRDPTGLIRAAGFAVVERERTPLRYLAILRARREASAP